MAPESPEAGLIVSLFKILKDQLERTTPSITTAAIDFINGEGKKKKRSGKGGAVGRDNGTIVSAHDSFGNSASVAGGGSEVALLDLLRAISGEAAEAEVRSQDGQRMISSHNDGCRRWFFQLWQRKQAPLCFTCYQESLTLYLL